MAFALAQEIAHPLPWSITAYSDMSLRYLLDSSVMAWYQPSGNYGMGTYGGVVPLNFPVLRSNNRPQTTFAPPMWTHPWLTQAGLIGATRQETIGKVMDWMRDDSGIGLPALDRRLPWQRRLPACSIAGAQHPRATPGSPILSLLIDEPTYQSRFTSDLTVNITDYSSPALAYVGYAAAHFP